MEGWDKPPSHAWHLSRRRCHGDGLLCKWLTQPPEMQPDIQEDAITPPAGQSAAAAAAPSWSRETTARSSVRLYKLHVFSAAEISHIHLIRGWRECTAGPRTCCSNTNTHAAKLQRTKAQASLATNTASAGFMRKAFSSAGAAEDTAIVELRDGWRRYVSVSADWNTAEFIRFQISKVTTSRWNPRKPNTGPYTPERRHNGREYGPFENITMHKDGFAANVKFSFTNKVWLEWIIGSVHASFSTSCNIHIPLFSQRRSCLNAETKHCNNCSSSFCGSYSSVWTQASTLGPCGFINTDSSDVKSQDTKLFHPSVKLLQCAESKEETELNSHSCVQSTLFHMSTKDPNSWRRASWRAEFRKSEFNSSTFTAA